MRAKNTGSGNVLVRYRLARSIVLVFLIPTAPSLGQTSQPAEAPQKLQFRENNKLPKTYRAAVTPRPDGSELTCYIGGAADSLDQTKPILVYLEGSGAQSLFYEMEDGRVGVGVLGLLAREAGDTFHVVGAEKRGVNFGEHAARGSGEGARDEYTKHATLADRVADVRLMLTALLADARFDARRVVLLGHSEGADVAAAVAGEDPRVTHVAFLSGGGALQFYDFFVMRRKQMAEQGASAEKIEESIGQLEDEIRDVIAHPDSETRFLMGHAYKRWSTFATQSSADALVRTGAKIFAAHGSEDTSVPIESFDFLVARLLCAGKPNVTIRRYPGRDHSYIRKGDEPGYDGFVEVLREVLRWAQE